MFFRVSFFIKMIKIKIELLENAIEFLDNEKQYNEFVLLYVRMLQGIQVHSKYKNVNILLKLYSKI